MNKLTFLLLLLFGGCCTDTHSPRQLRFEQRHAWFYSEHGRAMRVGSFEPLKSEAARRWFADDEVVNFKYSCDPIHFELYATLVILPSGAYDLISGEEEVVYFLKNRMKKFNKESDIHDFLELFTSMRGYALVEKAPEIMDVRVREGENISDQDYTLNIHESDHSWDVEVSIEVNRMSGSIHRYQIKLPKLDEASIKMNRGKLQFISDYIR